MRARGKMRESENFWEIELRGGGQDESKGEGEEERE